MLPVVRYVVHPTGITGTPQRLAEALTAQGLRAYPSPELAPQSLSFAEDVFLIYPPPGYLRGAGAEYGALYGFFSRNKLGQRRRLAAAGLPVPATIGRHGQPIAPSPLGYIVRPLRHAGGRDYRRTDDPGDFVEGEQYLSAVFPKQRELRVICCRGERVVTLEKDPPAAAGPADPWNHEAGARFRTIERAADDPLVQTGLYERLPAVPFLAPAHLLGIDVMLAADARYAILEVNACPGLAIERNLRAVAERLAMR